MGLMKNLALKSASGSLTREERAYLNSLAEREEDESYVFTLDDYYDDDLKEVTDDE